MEYDINQFYFICSRAKHNIVQITDVETGKGIQGAVIHARNITRVDRFYKRNDDIDHEVTSGV